MALDSRYISQANGSEVSSWTNKANSSNNAEQSTSANRPIFQTNSLNGNPGVNFDGSNDFISWTTGIAMRFGLCLFKSVSPQAEFGAMWGPTSGNWEHLFGTTSWLNLNWVSDMWSNGTWRKNGTTFNSQSANSLSSNADIVSVLLTSSVGTNIGQTRERVFTDRVISGLLYQYQIYPNNPPSDSLIKKLQFSAAYSFKIACS